MLRGRFKLEDVGCGGSKRPPGAPPRCHLERLEPRAMLSLQGNQLFPADSPWNRPITDAPVAIDSGVLVTGIGAASGLHPDFGAAVLDGSTIGIPYNVVTGAQPKV